MFLKTVFAQGIMELSLNEHNVHLLLHSTLIFKKHVEPSPLFLPHLQLLLHCTLRQDYPIPVRCSKAHGLCRSPERGGTDWAAHGSGSSSHCAVCRRARDTHFKRKPQCEEALALFLTSIKAFTPLNGVCAYAFLHHISTFTSSQTDSPYLNLK